MGKSRRKLGASLKAEVAREALREQNGENQTVLTFATLTKDDCLVLAFFGADDESYCGLTSFVVEPDCADLHRSAKSQTVIIIDFRKIDSQSVSSRQQAAPSDQASASRSSFCKQIKLLQDNRLLPPEQCSWVWC